MLQQRLGQRRWLDDASYLADHDLCNDELIEIKSYTRLLHDLKQSCCCGRYHKDLRSRQDATASLWRFTTILLQAVTGCNGIESARFFMNYGTTPQQMCTGTVFASYPDLKTKAPQLLPDFCFKPLICCLSLSKSNGRDSCGLQYGAWYIQFSGCIFLVVILRLFLMGSVHTFANTHISMVSCRACDRFTESIRGHLEGALRRHAT